MSDGIGFVTSNNANALWSFDLSTGQILDPDGMALTGISSDVFLFANARAAIPGNFPPQDPTGESGLRMFPPLPICRPSD